MSLIKKPSELNVQAFIKALIYGQPGLGKSTLALSAPNPLLLDFDKGVHRIRTEHQTDTVQISSWQDVIDLLQEDLTPYKTLVIDTAGKALDFMSAHLIKTDPKLGTTLGGLTLQGYGARKTMFRNFLGTVSMLGKHLVFVAHDTEEKSGDVKVIRPEIGGSSSGDLIKELDLVGYMQAIGKTRTISFDPEEKYYGKNTCQLEPVMQVPLLTDNTPNILLNAIFNTYITNLEKRQVKAGEYTDLLTLIEDTVNDLATTEEVNDFVGWIENLQHIWDSKFQARRLFGAKVKELGYTYDKDSNLFVDPKKAEKEKAAKDAKEAKDKDKKDKAAKAEGNENANGEASKEEPEESKEDKIPVGNANTVKPVIPIPNVNLEQREMFVDESITQ